MWLKRRLWPGLVELGMAFAGFLVGSVVMGALFGVVGNGPLSLGLPAVAIAVGALFYGWVGPRWAAAVAEAGGEDGGEARGEAGEDPDPPAPVAPKVTTPGAVLGTIALGVLAALGGSMVLGFLLELLGLPVKEQDRVLEIIAGVHENGLGAEGLALVVAATVLAPLSEEWFFRGLLFRRVSASSGRVVAHVISAVAFAAIHGNLAGLGIYVWLAVVFATVLERTGRLWPAVAVHMGNNACVLAMLFAGPATGAGTG